MSRVMDRLMMRSKVCPSWLYFSLNTFLRKRVHDPEKILSAYVGQGQTAIDMGCGPGFFTLGLARLVGKGGRVIAVDLQKRAIEIVTKKIKGTEFENTVHAVLADASSISVNGGADFTLSFWMLHEVPDKATFLKHVMDMMKPGGLYLVVEPRVHVSEKIFLDEIATAESCGMKHIDSPKVRMSRSALFSKPA